MNRREFLKYFSLFGASVALGKTSAYANWVTNKKRNGFPQGMLLIDAHSHPDNFPWLPYECDEASTLEKIEEIEMNASCFAAVGDKGGNTPAPVPFEELIARLDYVRNLEINGKVKIVRRHSDLPHDVHPPNFQPGAILAVEGGTSLQGDPSRVDVLYDYGVRLMTLMHYMINEIGDIMTAPPQHNGLTHIGQQFVERMMSLGILVDVAHAHIDTLAGVVEIADEAGLPIIDSHTSLVHVANYGHTRRRTLEEMEMIAETGGLVCTWPVRYDPSRITVLDWANENLEISRNIGTEHIGLGTDGCGLKCETSLIEGYDSILDLPKLVEAMDEVGFKRSEIEAYMGGNLFRVIKQCVR